MNIEESAKEIEKIKEIFIHLRNYGWINDIKKDINIENAIQAIETLLTAYEKEKETTDKLKKINIPVDTLIAEFERLEDLEDDREMLKAELKKEKEKNKKAYRKANNYLYFNDSADYEVALWEVIRTLRPDLAEKWDNGEYAELKYIEEE